METPTFSYSNDIFSLKGKTITSVIVINTKEKPKEAERVIFKFDDKSSLVVRGDDTTSLDLYEV